MKALRNIFVMFAVAFAYCANAADDPIRIEANEGVEWDREAKRYIASGDARLVQKNLKLGAEKLIVHYDEISDGTTTQTNLLRIDAEDNVFVQSSAFHARGDKGVYDMIEGIATLVGSDLQITNDKGLLVRARDTLEYWDKRAELIARGDATITNEGNHLRADVISAKLLKDPNTAKQSISMLQAHGKVQVRTHLDVITGDRARYDLIGKLATICGNVTIKGRGTSIAGDCAEANLQTGVSKIIAGQSGERVRVVIDLQK